MLALDQGIQVRGYFGPNLRALVLHLSQQGSCHLGFGAAVDHEGNGLV